MEVVLTRRTDDFVALQERTAIANREGADLFLSIHANASESPSRAGVETYFLNFANNLGAAAVAARENAASGQAMAALPDLVKMIALNNKLDESRELATDRPARDDRTVERRQQDGEGSRRQAGAVRRCSSAPRCRACWPKCRSSPTRRTPGCCSSSPYRQRIAEALVERRPQVSDVAEDGRDRRQRGVSAGLQPAVPRLRSALLLTRADVEQIPAKTAPSQRDENHRAGQAERGEQDLAEPPVGSRRAARDGR